MNTPPPIIPQAPPLPSPSKSPKTFFHHAATYSLLAPFVAVGVNIIIGASRANNPPTTRIETLVTAILLGFIFLSGLVFGIISLFGIGRYGRAGILWKAVIGIFIVVSLFLIAIPNFLRAREIARERYEQQYGHPPP